MYRDLLFPMAIIITSLATQSFAAPDETISGKIVRYECGDNCYLVIQPENGAELAALCVVDECKNWFEMAEMPAEYVGRNALVSIGTGKQYDGAGNEMGDMVAFTKVVIDEQ